MKTIKVREGKERSLRRRHPWVFQGSIAKGQADAGETVRVESHEGEFLAWASYSPTSMIRARAWSFEEGERIDHAFFKRRIQAALDLRARLPIRSDGVRLIHGEADGLPGLIVDRYAEVLSAQFLSAGTERWKQAITDILVERTGVPQVFERSDSGVRTLEGLQPVTGWLRGGGGATEVTIQEHDWKLILDVAEGHKTGFYLDQRDNRLRFSHWVRHFGLKRVLNCYCYTGGFSVAALAGGATEVVSVDSSAPALARASAHVTLNGFDAARHTARDADVNQTLREAIKDGQTFDAIVLDPPKFAPTAAHAERAARAYKDINRLAFKLLSPGGLLLTFSCSGGVGPELFHKIVAGAGMDAGVDGFILDRMRAAPDHPQTICFPEGEYLKGLAIIKRA
ncbi:MAG: class I SAM-dependent rRNA methyltransferase [Betaproteobacteria bacterium]|jgi:23S rRNA (cytosine1962-C5)-methyltransferase